MKHYCKILLAVTAALVLLVQSGCQEQAKAPDEAGTVLPTAKQGSSEQKAQTDQPAPRITFEETVYDFGQVSSGKKYSGQFELKNTGSGILKITDVNKCCGAAVTLDKKELAPGESGTLKVEYYTGRSSGLMSRQLRVFSNDETNPQVILTIKAQVVIRVDFQPQRIDLLLNKDNAGCPKITIRSLDKQPFSIVSFQSTGQTITADIDPAVEATKFVLEPKVDIQKLQKRSAGLATISLTHPELEKVSIYFTTKPRFQLTPSGVFLLHPTPEKPSINRITLVSNYGEQFKIESTSSEKGFVKLLRQDEIAKGYRLEVEIMPPPRDDTGGFNDVLHLHLDNGEKLSVKCYGQYAELKE